MKARTAHLQVTYEGVDISADLRPHLLAWTHTDNLSGQADDLQISLEDKNHLWSGPWLPDTGAALIAKAVRDNWEKEGMVDALPLGQFEVDEIEVNDPPSTVTIKGISVPESSSLRGEEKNRAWENTKLSVITRDIANKAKLKLYFDVDDDPEYDRIEQTSETDLSFLMRLCSDAGLCLKVTGNQIVIIDEEKYEARPPVTTLTRGDSRIKSFRGKKTTQGLYRACRVEYHSPKRRKNVSFTFTPKNAPKTGRTLLIDQRVASTKEAERLAKKKLREANKNAVNVSLTMVGDNMLVAGHTVMLAGYGKAFDGKYIITQITRSQQSGYEMSLELRKCLEGY